MDSHGHQGRQCGGEGGVVVFSKVGGEDTEEKATWLCVVVVITTDVLLMFPF